MEQSPSPLELDLLARRPDRSPRIQAGRFRGRRLRVAPGRSTRPARARLRQSLFDSIQADVPGSHWLDLFAGSGSLGLEALSRGAEHATFVEVGGPGVRCLSANIAAFELEAPEAVLLRRRIPEVLHGPAPDGAPFHLVSLDPPFAVSRDGDQLTALVAGIVLASRRDWFAADCQIAWEEPSDAHAPAIEGFEAETERAFGSSRLRLFRRI